ncbi:MAG: hypothetical protein HYS26_00860 [Candidatus Kaiserbacteria bacterium]|nr:MAG: hypothetical protein HYS26_00860 [Candidatus Kaiserbacteria bacterium]
MSKNLQDLKVSRDDKTWEAEIRATITPEAMERYKAAALKELQKTAKLDGFRVGMAPVDRIVQIYGDQAILKRAAEDAVQHELPELLAAENLMIVESPRVSLEAPVAGKPVAFTARAALAPEVQLPDYTKIAKAIMDAKEEVSVSDEEHAEATAHLRRERARIDRLEAGVEAQKAHEESRALKPEELPALDDEFVKTLGYESSEKFSETLRSNIKHEKEVQAREKRRATLLDSLVEQSSIRFPAVLREYELDDMEARMKSDLERMGTSLEGYLAQTKKTIDSVRAEWKDAADKRAKVRLILAEIARKENVQPPAKELDAEFAHAKQHYPEAEDGALRAHIAGVMRNEATLRLLEGDATPVQASAHDHAH